MRLHVRAAYDVVSGSQNFLLRACYQMLCTRACPVRAGSRNASSAYDSMSGRNKCKKKQDVSEKLYLHAT